MKNGMKITGILMAFVAWQAHAVKTDACPRVIRVDLNEVSPNSDTQLAMVERAEGVMCEVAEMKPIRNNLAGVADRAHFLRFNLQLRTTRSGVCVYYSPASQFRSPKFAGQPVYENDGSAEARLFTRNGKDILRIPVMIGEEIAWIYQTVTAYSAEGISTKAVKGSPILAIFDHGNPSCTVGWTRGTIVE